ncbi:MAG: hypothetical protein CVU65_14005 [Deltaproteobacteria bacterium HGW-Deltaproteobacteria-22]|nr:MAG: hypothetical protein CVU65_14005 [Deltaproteobacteria bacterium HGW-Deltaproteobacteria-22]
MMNPIDRPVHHHQARPFLLLCCLGWTLMACNFDTTGLQGQNSNNTNNVNNNTNLNNANNLNNSTPVCPNGLVETPEACDDGNATPDDGCSPSCVIDEGYACAGGPSVCTPVCGDGLILGVEACDDGNTSPDDGCSALCAIDDGYACTGAPSVCTPVCGDGLILDPEECDDGNASPGDGCTTCLIDGGWRCVGSPSVCIPDDWYQGAWHSRRLITVPTGTVTADLADFPMLVHLPAGALSGAQPDADDVLFTLEDGLTKLSHEILLYEPAGRGLLAFVKVPLVYALHDTVLYVYYGNPSAPDQQDVPGVYTAGFAAVLHLSEEGAGLTDEYLDATGNGYHGTGGGPAGAGDATRSPTRDTGVFGSSQRFPGSTVNPSRAIHLRPVDDSAWNALTISVWMNPQDTADQRVFGRTWGNGPADIVWLLGKTDKPKYRLRTVTNRVDTTNGATFPLNTWIHYALVWQAAGAASVYGNGVLLHSTNVAGDTLYVDPVEPIIGNSPLYPTDPRAFLGRIQEARISRVARTAAWLTAEAGNQSDPDGFHVLGVEETF